jgi:hypothetical protein
VDLNVGLDYVEKDRTPAAQSVSCRYANWRLVNWNYVVELCLLGYNDLQSVESKPTFQRNVPAPSFGVEAKQEAGDKQTLLGLHLNLEVGSDVFLRNVGRFSADYTSLYLRRWDSR